TVLRISEAMTREKIAAINPELAPAIVDDVARKVGIGAIVFANLAPQRDKDIDFDIDNAVSIEGAWAPSRQYSHARGASLARKAGDRLTGIDGVDVGLLTHAAEWAVACRL